MQQNQLGDPNYKAVYHYFHHSIRNFIKAHKQCLPQIDDFYLVKIPKDELQLIQENIQKYLTKHLDKLKKQNMARNMNIYKNIVAYQQSYPQPKQPQAKLHPILSQTVSLFSKISPRPFSSIIPKTRNQTLKSKKEIETKQEINKSMLMSRRRNVNQQQQQLQIGKQPSVLLENDTVYIYDRHINSLTSRNHKSFTPSFNPRQGKSVKESYFKLTQDKYKKQLRNRILLINSSFAINLARCQGYEPRTYSRKKQLF